MSILNPNILINNDNNENLPDNIYAKSLIKRKESVEKNINVKNSNKTNFKHLINQYVKIIFYLKNNGETINNNSYSSTKNLNILKKYNKLSSIFDLNEELSISIENYIIRLVDTTEAELNTIIYSLTLIDKLCNDNKIIITNKNMHQLVFISLLISLKLLEDKILKMNYYSCFSGISLYKIAVLESAFLELIDYNIIVEPAFFENYRLIFKKGKKKRRNECL